MELIKREWTGTWDNFEGYIESTDPYLVQAWKEAEAAAGAMPMFAQGVKAFWRMACTTVTRDNARQLAGWEVGECPDGITIDWLGLDGGSLGKYDYQIDRILEKGLEGKPNLLFCAGSAPEGCPFRYLLSMEPMPERGAHLTGGYVSHLHFQFAGRLGDLVTEAGQLVNPRWYATMCAGEGTLLDRCNIVRGLHRLPAWKELPSL